jgi:hypothetical protein
MRDVASGKSISTGQVPSLLGALMGDLRKTRLTISRGNRKPPGSSIAAVNKLYSDVCDVSGVSEAARKPVFGIFRVFLKLKLLPA